MLRKLNNYITLFFITVLITVGSKEAAAVQLQDLDIEKFNDIMSNKQPITLLFIFTSWCKACKSAIPEVLELGAKYKAANKVEVVMLALDENVNNLKGLLATYKGYEDKFYYFNEAERKKIGLALFNNGIKYCGTIPHVTIFHNNRVIADDNYEIQSVKNFIAYLCEKESSLK
ncbi:MAG: thioredoxin family protein [Candidatus Midichloria sp.]|nr:thioredoxin family protein [Candidatus Midichloria sp.]